MMIDLATYVPWVATIFLAAILIALPRRDRIGRLVGLAFAASVLFTGLQILTAAYAVPNYWIDLSWPMVHGAFLVWAFAHSYEQRTISIAGMVLIAVLAGTQASGISVLVWPLTAAIILGTVWYSPLHRTVLEKGLWLYHGAALVPFVIMVSIPGAFRAAFIGVRACQLGGVCLVLWWAYQRYRSRVPRPSSATSPLSDAGSSSFASWPSDDGLTVRSLKLQRPVLRRFG